MEVVLPIDLSLLVGNTMGFFSGYPAVEPQLSYVDDCVEKEKEIHFKYIFKLFKIIKLKEKMVNIFVNVFTFT